MSQSADQTTPPQIFRTGEVLSNTYEIKGVIGEGAMGQVLEAQDIKLSRRVAIKVAWPHIGTVAIRHEARALAAIRHPGLVAVYAVNEHAGHEYVVMERLHGVSFERLIVQAQESGDPLSVLRVLDLLIPAFDALSAVHQAGLVHRDLKPANIMLAPGDRVVLVDLGLFLPQFETGQQQKIVGSPLYMAPEQIRNRVEAGAWHLVDLYAMGTLAFEMLTGEAPFQSTNIREVLEGQIRKEVPDLSQFRDDVPPQLAALIRELLSKNPTERPQTAESVVWALRRIKARFDEQGPRETFSVLIATTNHAHSRALSAYVRRVMPDAEVRTVTDGEQTMDQIQRRAPNVLLVDPGLPGTNAVEICMYLRGGSADSSIVMLSPRESVADAPLLEYVGVQWVESAAIETEQVGKLIRDARRKGKT